MIPNSFVRTCPLTGVPSADMCSDKHLPWRQVIHYVIADECQNRIYVASRENGFVHAFDIDTLQVGQAGRRKRGERGGEGDRATRAIATCT